MISRIAIALFLLLSVGAAAQAAESQQSGDEAPMNEGMAKDSVEPPANDNAQDADDMSGQSEAGAKDRAPLDVHRHRPGACPEGPPCKKED
jgi:hypothetical protein